MSAERSAIAVALQIGGDDAVHRRRIYAQISQSQRALSHDVVSAQQLNLISSERWRREMLQNCRLKPGKTPWNGNQWASSAGPDGNAVQNIPEGQKTLRPKILLSDVDIDDRIRRMESAIGKTEYLLAEIFLPVENRKQDGEKKALANRLVAEIRERGAPFPAVARQFSQSAGAAQGGNLGWVPEDQLDPAIAKALKSADKGKMTAPVRVADGYHIVLLRDTRTITKESIPSREQVMNMIGTEALERLARRKLRDLRDSAFIDTRA